MMKGFSLKFDDIERRVYSIETKLSAEAKVRDSGTKDHTSTIGNVSPGFTSSYGNTGTKANTFQTP